MFDAKSALFHLYFDDKLKTLNSLTRWHC